MGMYRHSCKYMHCVGVLSIVPPYACGAILIEILQSPVVAQKAI